jgi:hypothetical protein
METEIEGVAVLVIQDSATSTQFNCLPSRQMAAQAKFEALNLAPTNLVEGLLGPGSLMTGSEQLDGKDCAIFEYAAKDGTRMKGWVWKENGLLLKTVSQVSGGQEVTEIKSVSFADIPDSQFKLPGDVRLVSEAELNKALSQTQPQSQPQTPALTGQYKNLNWGYSIKFPEGWRVDDSNPATVKISNVEAWVFVSMFRNQTMSLDDWVKVSQTVYSKYPDYRELTSEKVALSDGTPAFMVICKYTENGKAQQEIRALAVTTNSALSLTASATDSGWPKYGTTLGKIIDSLTFPTNVAPTSQPTTVPGSSPSGKVYSNPAWNYSISVLNGWTVDDKDKENGHLIIWSPDHGGLMEVFAQEVPGANLDTYLNDLISRYRSAYPGFQEMSRQKIVLSGGLTAYALLSTRTSSSQPEKELAVMTVAGSRQVQIYARTWLKSWDSYSSGFEKIAYSLTVTSPN